MICNCHHLAFSHDQPGEESAGQQQSNLKKNYSFIISITTHLRQGQTFGIKVASTRKDSIKDEKKDNADFKVFSDGSGCDDRIGASAILYSKNCFTPVSKLKYFLGLVLLWLVLAKCG